MSVECAKALVSLGGVFCEPECWRKATSCGAPDAQPMPILRAALERRLLGSHVELEGEPHWKWKLSASGVRSR